MSGDSCRQEYWDGTVAGEPDSEAAELVGLGKELKEAYMLSDIRLKHDFALVPTAFCSIGARNDGSDFSGNFSSLYRGSFKMFSIKIELTLNQRFLAKF